MRSGAWVWCVALALLPGMPGVATAQGRLAPLAGWYDVFPQVWFFSAHRFGPPVVGKAKDGRPVYSQTLRYEAATNLVRAFDFTVMRDPAVKTRYAPEALRALDEPPQELKVAGYRAWRWKDGKVVVVLDEDKAVVMTKAPDSVAGFPLQQADKVNWKRIAKALGAPPRTDFTPTVATFRVLAKGAPAAGLDEWCGPAAEVEASKAAPDSYRRTYRLADGSRVVVVGGARIDFVRHETKDGKVVDLVK
jgi:hypothetical protein